MKHGEHIPAGKRDEIALIAANMATRMSTAEAKQAVAGMFRVSATTARRLISRGRFLKVNSPVAADPAVQGEG
jgi:2-keto-4-pentenoate hydratase/2-oxohepta-3-ene-1,7-dioic acid hydratase in catechol pathway